MYFNIEDVYEENHTLDCDQPLNMCLKKQNELNQIFIKELKNIKYSLNIPYHDPAILDLIGSLQGQITDLKKELEKSKCELFD